MVKINVYEARIFFFFVVVDFFFSFFKESTMYPKVIRYISFLKLTLG